MTIAVDFDWTIADAPEWPTIGPVNIDLVRKLKRYQESGAKIILHTSRGGTNLKEAIDYCETIGLQFYDIVQKPRADIYIDDRAVRPEEF